MPENQKHNRLPRNFHKTFKPERMYINAMLRFAAAGKEGDYKTIAAETGIPTGESSGKVPAILDYCRGMGLISLSGTGRSAIKHPVLTSFGSIVFKEDKHLKTPVSQWMAHLNLCSPLSGADIWYQTFFNGAQSIGAVFSRDKLESFLSVVCGVEKGGLIGPMIGTYQDDAALKLCGALIEDDEVISRRPAPAQDSMAPAYGAWILQLLNDHFPDQRQVSITDLDSVAGWRTIPGWDSDTYQRILMFIERKNILEVDRHMNPWLLSAKESSAKAWKNIFEDII